MSEELPPERAGSPRRGQRDRFPPIGAGRNSMRGAALAVYGVLTVGFAGLALYMALVEQRPLTSAWVAAPAIGALWFALRLFMIWGSRG